MDSNWFSSHLLDWFDIHGRKHLPWQKSVNAYRVWISEIMLQQTQVATVIPYYERFMQRFPDVSTLASASADEVLHYWSGLGYYARGRNLHRAAIKIVDDHQGVFPIVLEDVLALPGIGKSTAGAILSIACQQRQPILDGNVKRVLTRFHAVEGWPGKASVQKSLWLLAEHYTPLTGVADYTQAIMDLGATLCTRSKPDCHACPLKDKCQAHAAGSPTNYPSKRPKRTLPVRKLHMLLLVNEQNVFLQQRPPVGIWGGLWGFPEFETQQALEGYAARLRLIAADKNQWAEIRHTLSHFHMDITPHLWTIDNPTNSVMEAGNVLWYNWLQATEIGLAAPVKKLLQRMKTEGILL
ncbi:MAG: A/G-specific adenine glycosylase [Gammaproteobacteria bacterium]